MSLLDSLPAPRKPGGLSKWEQDDEDAKGLVAAPQEEPEKSVLGKVTLLRAAKLAAALQMHHSFGLFWYVSDRDPQANATVLKVIQTDGKKANFWQVVPKGPDVAANPHPDSEAVKETAASTMEALSRVVDAKLTAANPKALKANARPGGPQYIKYTPQQTNRHHNSGVDHRIIQMQEMPVDPLEPPKFRHTKVPKVPDEMPVPVLHSPPRPVTKEDQVNWKIPPCVSAWKNPKGYTIPLDKRLAADGRGMQEETINRKHMNLAHALYAAEETARRETELQARLQNEIKQRQKQKKEMQLRALAAQARMGGASGAVGTSLASRLDDAQDSLPPPPPPAGRSSESLPGPPPPGPPPRSGPNSGQERLTAEEAAEKRKRDELRHEREKERERELRLEAKNRAGGRRSKVTRDRDRDVSEKIALGQADVSHTAEVQYDSRLFNRDGGLAAGFGGDDTYNFYDKELFADRSAMGLYRANARDAEVYGEGVGPGKEPSTKRFRPDRGFEGSDAAGTGPRTGPVQFDVKQQEEADPFGIESFLGGVAKK